MSFDYYLEFQSVRQHIDDETKGFEVVAIHKKTKEELGCGSPHFKTTVSWEAWFVPLTIKLTIDETNKKYSHLSTKDIQWFVRQDDGPVSEEIQYRFVLFDPKLYKIPIIYKCKGN